MRKKIRFRMLKRILILLLCTTLVSGTCLDRYKIEVHATSVAVSTEAGAEIMMALWNLVVASMVASGAGEFVANYDQEKPVFEKFMDVYGAFVGAPDNDYVTLEDGTVVSFSEFYEMYEIGTITIPDVEDWELYRDRVDEDCDDEEDYILKNWDADAIRARWEEITGGGSSGSPPEPQDEPSFHKLKGLLLSSGLVAALTATMSSLWKGEIEGVDPAWFENLGYTGKLETDIDGNYVYKAISYDGKWTTTAYLVSTYRVGGYYTGKSLIIDRSGGTNFLYTTYDTSGSSWILSSQGRTRGDIYGPDGYYANFPVFGTQAELTNYINTGDDTGCINNIYLDYNALASNLPAIMAPKTDTQLSTSALQSMYARMKAAYQTQVKPQIETETDTDTNTQTYTDAMTQAVTETDSGTDTDTGTDTGTDTDPDTDEDTGADTDTEVDIDIEDYKVDLRQVFPFCIPFDLMALFGVLAADPVAPRFEIPFVVPSLGIEETYVIDLSFLDEQMVLLRKLELVGFIIGLMLLTGKVIKW